LRAQLHAAYGKLGVNRRAELVHLLARYGFR
jgi:DNA-binding CsgD family transcriptional regulator